MQPWGEPATQPSLSPLTELNELSILSVLEENSWERPGGGGWGRRDKGKDLAPTWTAPRLRGSSTLLLHRKEVDPETPLPSFLTGRGTGRLARPEVGKAKGTAASALHSFPSVLPASSFWV